jgi:nitrogen regulatory protein PII 2
MKEVMAFIRANKVNETKKALGEAGFPSFTCRRVLGRGKKMVDSTVLQMVLEHGELPVSPVGEAMTESTRLIPKRFFTLVVEDACVKNAVDTIIRVNQTGNPGDGKIFIFDILETYKVRTGETDL